MKKFKLIAMVLLTILMGVNFNACSDDDDEQITQISITEGPSLDVLINTSGVLSVKYEPDYLTAPNCTWNSSNDDIISIDKFSGKYTAKGTGKATITVTATDLQLSAQCEINVSPIEIKNVSLSQSEKELFIGDEFSLEVSFEPENATYKDVEWTSSDKTIATVDDNGKVKAIKEGICEVIVSTKDGKNKASCKLAIKPVNIESIVFSSTEKEIEKNETFNIEVSIAPQNATYKDLLWTSSDTLIATVNNGLVTGMNKGNCTITATDVTKTIKAECKVKVNPISVKGITLDNTSLKLMAGDSKQLSYTILPSNAENKDVKWEIQDNTIASITNDGTVKGLKIGKTIAKVITLDGNFSAECNIEIVDISDLVSSFFGSYSAVNLNGLISGNISCFIKNESSKDITLKSLQLIEGDTGIGRNVMSLDDSILKANSQVGYNVTIRISIYKPIFRWKYVYEGKEYTLDIEFDTGRSSSRTNLQATHKLIM